MKEEFKVNSTLIAFSLREKIKLNATRVVFTFRLNATLNSNGGIYFEISGFKKGLTKIEKITCQIINNLLY